jgi:hypothetical protein
MGQGLKNACATYSRLRDIMTGPIPGLDPMDNCSEEEKEEARRRGRPPEGYEPQPGMIGVALWRV